MPTSRLKTRTIRTLAIGAALGLGACADQLPTDNLVAPPVGGRADATLASQQAPPGHVRIGVVPTATSVAIGSDGDFTIVDESNGSVLFSGSAGEAVVTLGENVVTRTNYRLQVTCTSAAGRDDLIARAEAEGIATYAENAGPCWRVMLGEFASDAGWSIRAAFRQDMIDRGFAGTDSFWKLITITEGETNVVVTYGGVEEIASGPVGVSSSTGIIEIGGRPYRGVGEVWLNSQGLLAGINELPLESYLYGVVPNELPPVPYGEPEAQKAQAITARTYAIANLGKRRADGYDLLPTTSDQVYRGFASEHPVSTAAVDATSGIVAVHEGTLITTLYHSTSGGYTANSEDVYTAEVEYLRGVPDAPRGKAFENVPTIEVFKRAANPVNLRAAAEGDYEADWSVYHRWVADWTHDEMAAMVGSVFNQPVTEVTAVEVTDRADHGRALQVAFVTDVGTFTAEKDRIRSYLRYPNASGGFSSLRSTLFFIEPVTDSTGEITGWKAWGGGWGHGVGMSQTGAVGMATRGHDYESILKHYYQGIELEHRPLN